VNHSSA